MIPLLKIRFYTNTNPPYAPGDELIVFLDETTGAFTHTLNGSALPDATYNVTLGPQIDTSQFFNPTLNWFLTLLNIDGSEVPENNTRTIVIFGNTIVLGGGGEIQYRFCTDTTLTTFAQSPFFPYVVQEYHANSPSCIVDPGGGGEIVCDIAFQGIPIVVKPTTATSLDGSITVVATSTLSSVQYDLVDNAYGNMANTTGVFTGLGVGNYTIYARDSHDCRATIDLIIDAPIVVGVTNSVYYRQDYKDLHGRSSRVDIFKKDWTGDITEVMGSGTPFELRLRGDNGDFFDTILATEATQNLFSQTNFQYANLFTADDRTYQVVFYKDLGAGYQEFWRGFVTPLLYSESYVNDRNYYVGVESTDGLAALKETPFTDTAGNIITGKVSLIQIISFILLKTDLNLPIRVAVNLYDSEMDQGSADDPLEQTYIDAASYLKNGEPISCAEVLDNILGAFGACVVQWAGYWHIRRRGELKGLYAFREFSAYGVYLSNGTNNPTTSHWRWQDRSQNLQIIASRGKISITHELIKNLPYFRNAGFEEQPGVPGYTLLLNGNSATMTTVQGNPGAALQIISDSSSTSSYGNDAYIITEPRAIILSDGDVVKLSFDFYVSVPTGPLASLSLGIKPAKFTKFKFSWRIGTYYVQSNGSWDNTNVWLYVIVPDTDYNKWNTFEIQALAPVTGTTDTALSISHGKTAGLIDGGAWSFISEADLKAEVTAGLPVGDIKWIYYETFLAGTVWTTTLLFYKLRAGTDSDSFPDILRPDDYHGTTNPVVWELISEYIGQKDYAVVSFPTIRDGADALVDRFDNLSLEVLPGGVEQPSEKVYEFFNNSVNRKSYAKTYINGDAPVTVVNGLYSYINVFTLADGTATRLWTRSNINESQPLLSILAKQVGEQTYIPKFKLTGTIWNKDATNFFGFDACLTEYGRFYAPAGMSLNDKRCEYRVELFQVTEEQADGVFSEFSQEEFAVEEFGKSFNI